MASPYLGQIQPYGFNFPPKGWAFCNGDIISIAQNPALFQLIGTTYGGDGSTSFALPDMRGRVPIHFGRGVGLSTRLMGEKGGAEDVTLTNAQLPSHNHTVVAVQSTGVGGTGENLSPTNAYPATDSSGDSVYSLSQPNTMMGASMVGNTGGGQSHYNMQPFIAINWCIAMQGVYPSMA